MARLLVYWRTIERGIKKAEQISGNAMIPAINELRYASRQIYFGILAYAKPMLNDGDKSVIRKRIIIAEQYLLNADHDTLDATITFFREAISRVNNLYGRPEIILHFPEYPLLCQIVEQCEALILQTRGEYEKRKQNYDRIRNEYLDSLVGYFRKLESAEVNAEYNKRKLERELVIARGKTTIWRIFTAVGALGTLLGLVLYAWGR
ncbi:MAG: hypothetical protein ACRED5_15635 [Propylenella sp.]